MPSLFSTPFSLELPDSDIWYLPNFLDKVDADALFTHLRNTIPWQQDDITVFGKTYPQPRLTALFGNNNKSYSYATISMQPHIFTPALLQLKKAIEQHTVTTFTSCLLNLYRDGKDSNGWHSDNEKELGTNPVIASVSLGAERMFHLKHRKDASLKHKMVLAHGSLLLMQGTTQHHWLHQLPKTTKPIGARINLTFRVVY